MPDAPDGFRHEGKDDQRDGKAEELREDCVEGQEEACHPIRYDEPQADTQSNGDDDAGKEPQTNGFHVSCS